MFHHTSKYLYEIVVVYSLDPWFGTEQNRLKVRYISPQYNFAAYEV